LRAPPIAAFPSTGVVCHGARRHFGSSARVVDPLDNRRQLVKAVLHRRARQHEAIRRIQALDGQRGLGRPVLDPLRLVEDDDVRGPFADEIEVTNELLVIPQEESAPAGLDRGLALAGRPLDDGRGRVGEELPFTEPLKLQRGRHDDQPAADAARVPEGMTGGNRLRGLAETHVVGEEQPFLRNKPAHAVELIGIERLLERLQRMPQGLPSVRGPDLARESRALFPQQRVQRRLARAVAERRTESIHERQPLLWTFGNNDSGAVSPRWMQPAPQIAVRRAGYAANARQPVAGARERADGIPLQRRRAGKPLALDVAVMSSCGNVFEDGDKMLAQAERIPEEVGALTTAVKGLNPAEQRAVRAGARLSTSCRIEPQQPAPWPSDNLNLVGVRGRAPAEAPRRARHAAPASLLHA
jgi:hypothetical protein